MRMRKRHRCPADSPEARAVVNGHRAAAVGGGGNCNNNNNNEPCSPTLPPPKLPSTKMTRSNHSASSNIPPQQATHLLVSLKPTTRNQKNLPPSTSLLLILLLSLSTVILLSLNTVEFLLIRRASAQHLPHQYAGPLSSQRQQNPFNSHLQQSMQHNAQTRQHLPSLVIKRGGEIAEGAVTLLKQYNPIIITSDIIVRKDARLIIEPGTELLFEKRKGIIVYGSIEIRGNPYDKVKLRLLKSQQSATTFELRSHHYNGSPGQQRVRLVDGDLPSEGRVQIKFNDRWHSLCTNSKNLTASDIKVICQQVGYEEGQWYKWFPRWNETILQMMSKSFMCNGNEQAITQCKRWNRVRVGGGVCDYHSDIGVRCSQTLKYSSSSDENESYQFWRGLEFRNSEYSHNYTMDDQMKQKVSKSTLSHLIVSDAGANEAGNATAAIRVFGQPPVMTDVEVKNSVYGIMIEETDDAFSMRNIRLVGNLANPLSVNTSWGKITLDNMHIVDNGGDGIRVTRYEKLIFGTSDFCKFNNLGTSQTYPVVLSHEQSFFNIERDCCQEFLSQHQLTVHFPVLRSTPNNLLPGTDSDKRLTIPEGVSLGKDAHLLIYDDYRDDLPFRLKIHNNTRAQSIVSKSGRLKVCFEPATYRTVLFTIKVVADYFDEMTGIAHDLEVSNSYINSNQGRGIWVDNQRSGTKIFNTTVSNHDYLAGVHIENGTGEVIIQGSNISNNMGHGVLINLAGGYYDVDNSTIADNSLKGIFLVYDQRPELVSFNHTFHLGYTLIKNNGEQGLFIGNVCTSDAFWNVSMNSFARNKEDAIFFQSCFPTQENVDLYKNSRVRMNMSNADLSYRYNYQELHITHNVFSSNLRRAVHMSPVFFVKSFIRHNLFKEHELAVLFVSNQGLPYNELNQHNQAPVNLRIASNRFHSNRGRYVANIGLQEDNPKHSLVFTKNIITDNIITEPYSDLRPRSRVAAVVVVSSSNTKVVRNRFENPLSSFEMGTHLDLHFRIINATTNYWGLQDAKSIYKRIFDRKNRYNLAQIEFLQYLLRPEDLEYATDISFDRERDKLFTRSDTSLGGEILGYVELPVGTYTVHDDIFIRAGAHLALKSGTVIKFLDSVGMMVQGRLDAIGLPSSNILFTSNSPAARVLPRAQSTQASPSSSPVSWRSHQPEGVEESTEFDSVTPYETMNKSMRTRPISKRQATGNPSIQTVRLSQGTMGRLEVMIDGALGTVCDYNFDINDAAVVCQQLGMILNKEDWLLERSQYASNDQQQLELISTNALMTNLRCDPTLDTDVTKCKAEFSSKGDFDGMCNSEVGIRCFPPSWSGIRLGMGAETSILSHVTIQKAGMFDYATFSLKPALQIDLNRHFLSNLNIKQNSDSALGIIWNDVIGRHFNELSLVDSKFHNNEKHGIEMRSKGLTIRSCSISNNRLSGLDYNPRLTQYELEDLSSWMYTHKNYENIVILDFATKNRDFFVPSSEESFKFFIVPSTMEPNIRESFTVSTEIGHMLSAHLLRPIHPESTENLNMSFGLNTESPPYDLRINMTSFPMVSSSYKLHFNYSSGTKPRGNIALYIRSRFSNNNRFNNRDFKYLSKQMPANLISTRFEETLININSKLLNSLIITHSNLTKNGIGMNFKQPNYPFDPHLSYNIRFANETVNITNSIFDSNHYATIILSSDDMNFNNDINVRNFSFSDIHYHLFDNTIRKNKDGIRQINWNLLNSHNIFHMTINGTNFDSNKGGGINLLLPYYWRYDINSSHTINISNNTFTKNVNFEFNIDGHYTQLNMTRNLFRDNRCKNALIAISGMEKRMLIEYNIIEHNSCNQVVDFNIESHADKLGLVPFKIRYNSIRHNRKPITNATYSAYESINKHHKSFSKLHPMTTDFALGLRGVQPAELKRNLIVNLELRFELVAAIVMNPDDRMILADENYWGSVLQTDIVDRIFDYDDWNSLAIVEVSPFLASESFSAALIYSHERIANTKVTGYMLGGRLTKSLTLPARKEPYLIESDLTIMPGVRLVIDRGVTLEFMPGVGILVLGDLIAVGSRDKPITMRPIFNAADLMQIHQYLLPIKSRQNIRYLTDRAYDYSSIYRFQHFAFPIDLGSIRLCKNEICNDGSHIYENNVEDKNLRQEVLDGYNNTWKLDGFLEIFNMTTLQWVPMCDPLFTEHTAKVVCRQLGFTHLSLFRRGRRYSIEQERIMSVRSWPETVQCEGNESGLSSCSLDTAGYLNHSTACLKDSNQFIYVYCQDFPDSYSNQNHPRGTTNDYLSHWGGIRFSRSSASLGSFADNSSNLVTENSSQSKHNSRLQYVNIINAGILHRKRYPAVQLMLTNVQLEYLAVINSAHHAVEIVTTVGNENYHQLKLINNTGVGINYVSISGSSSVNRLVPYLPLKRMDISYDGHGLINICGAMKEIQIDDRIFISYRYSSQAVDCIKIIRSKLNIKHIGIRMLQFDLFNSTAYTIRPDYLRIYDGSIFDIDSRLIVELGVTDKHRVERPELRFYQTTDNSMTLRLHASSGNPMQGFIAEVVTTPVTYHIQRDQYNNITLSELHNNKLGALNIVTAGESSPNLIIRGNRFDSNCRHLFGNFTSCQSAIYMDLQNCQKLRIQNNLIKRNQGGIAIRSYSMLAISALEAIIENNVFEENKNLNTLALLGPKSDPYQTAKVSMNFFTRNIAYYTSNLILSRIVSNFSHNIVSGNIGKHQIEVIGYDKWPLSSQSFVGNWIYNNTAMFETDRSTISGNSAGQLYSMNYLVNPNNHFEISTMNWSRYEVKPFHVPRDDEMIHLASGDGSRKDVIRKTVDAIPIGIVDLKKNELYLASVNAKNNWWGFNTSPSIHGRIRDHSQHEELIRVDFEPYLESNQTVLSDICSGGWKRVGHACLIYVGTRMTYDEAKNFCDNEQATLTLLRANHMDILDFVKSQDVDFDTKLDRIWIRSFEVSRDACPALNDFKSFLNERKSRNYDCHDKYSFVCERDPQVFVQLLYWHRETGGLIALMLAGITVVLLSCCSVCWAYKIKEKQRERRLRKSTIYSSMRSNRGGRYSSDNSLSELFLHRQIYNQNPEKSSITDVSLSKHLIHPNELNNQNRLNSSYSTSPFPQTSQTRMNSRQMQESFVNKKTETSPTYGQHSNSSRILYDPQPCINPTFVSPSPVSSIRSQQHMPVVDMNPSPLSPAPAYKNLPMGPRVINGGGSHSGSHTSTQSSSSYSGLNDIYQPPAPLPPLNPAYSQIRHSLANFNNNFPHGTYNRIDEADKPVAPAVAQQSSVIEDSEHSSVPTYYNNQIEPTNIPPTSAYIEEFNEGFNEAFNTTLQQRLENSYTSHYMSTRQSKLTDFIYQSITQPNNFANTTFSANGAARTLDAGEYDSPTQAVPDYSNFTGGYELNNGSQMTRAYSETAETFNRIQLVETSFDMRGPESTLSVSRGEKRTNPAPVQYAQSDSKLGSRVYLETSFE